ncbi:hypothetical protein [Pedobacter arcticus]|uniref:hypothetical protein n=1 Tax=Pedobacter arcticus TaxID=752140 RepID=UPI00036AE4BE|nr:hypothetical protein [Pedobacter arcticus]
MKSEDDKMELEKEAPTLATISKQNTFKTPEGYFNELTEQITNQIKISELINNPFEVPNNYFDELSKQITSSVHLNTFKNLESKGFGFDVPSNYFSEAQERIQNSVAKPKTSKIIKLHFIRYAAAACILFTTTLGVYFNVKYNTTVSHQLSRIPADDIETYLNQHTENSDLPMLIENIDDASDLSIDDFQLKKTPN